MSELKPSTPAQNEVIQRASWIGTALAGNTFLFLVLSIFLLITTGTWQSWVFFVLVLAAEATIIGSISLIRREKLALSGWLLLGWSLFAPLVVALTFVQMGYLAAIYILVAGFFIIRYLFPKESWSLATILSVVASVSSLATELLNPAWRQTSALILDIAPILTTTLAVALLAVILSQAWRGNIRMKIVTGFTMMALVSLGILGTVTYISYSNQVREDLRQRLLSMASLSALQQDAELHASILNPGDEETDAYKKIRAINSAIVQTDPNIEYLYTMRMNNAGQIYFVVDTGQPGNEELAALAEVYEDAEEILLENFATLDQPIANSEFYTDRFGTFLSAYAPFYAEDGRREGVIGIDIKADTVIEQERAVLFLILGTTGGAMIFVTFLGLFLGNLFTTPIIQLSQVAQKISAGDLSARAEIETSDEIGDLAISLNTMTNQLQQVLQNLEERVADRTRGLELAAEVGRSVSEVRELDVLLEDAAEIIRSRFDLYYVQVYLVDASNTNLLLQAGTGDVGAQLLERGHRLRLDTSSINGRAAVEKRSVVVANTAASATFRPNLLLPDTRSEMAIPLLLGDRLIGVLNLQSAQPYALNEENLTAFEALAGQIAVAVQNASLLKQAEQARAEVEAQARRLVRTGWKDYQDAIHRPEQTGFVFEKNEIVPLKPEHNLDENPGALAASISLTGQQIGTLVVDVEEERQTPQTVELVNIVARQVAQQVENLRLLESAERYRMEAEESARRLTREGWEEYFREKAGQSLSYLYDTGEVKAHESAEIAENALDIPIKVREENIGKLAVMGLDDADADTLSLVNTVSERLAEHLESLRLLEETQQGQLELNRRAQQLTAVSEISTISSRELDIEKMLDTVAELTRQKFELYHTRIFTYDANSDTLKAIAFGWQESERENLKDETLISLTQEQSLVARSARNRAPVVVNDVRNEPGWLPNPLLPETQSELAIPLVIGDEVLGVLDVQADRLAAFSDDDISIQMTLAAQIATALQNARSFARAQRQAEREALLNAISQKIQSATSVEAVLQIAARELGHALGAPRTIAQLSMKDK